MSKFWLLAFFFSSKMSDIGLLWSKITIFIIEITLKQLLLTKYGWNNWGRLGLKNPKLHFFDISGSSKFIVNINVQINVTHSIFIRFRFFFIEMLVTMSSITINNYWNYEQTANYRRTFPLRGLLGWKKIHLLFTSEKMYHVVLNIVCY